MALQRVCDGGCGQTTPNIGEFKEYGTAQKRRYCVACAITVEDYIAERDALHTQLAQSWSDEMAQLQSEWDQAHPQGNLPVTGAVTS